MALEGKQEYVDIKKIEFDKENPRIKRLLELQEEEYDREINELEIVSALMHTHTEDEEDLSPNRTQMTYAKLKKSIVTNQGILSSIIIKSDCKMLFTLTFGRMPEKSSQKSSFSILRYLLISFENSVLNELSIL